MSRYELTIVLPGKATSSQKKSVQERLEKLVKLLKGSVAAVEDWGEIELSYKIEKNTTGVFLFFVLELPKESVKDLREKLRLEDGILRYLLVRAERLKS